jgi:hypothetical protein
MGEACTAHGGDEKFWLEWLKGRTRLDLGVGGRILNEFREIRFMVVDWFHMGQNRDWWRALVNTKMNVVNFLPS